MWSLEYVDASAAASKSIKTSNYTHNSPKASALQDQVPKRKGSQISSKYEACKNQDKINKYNSKNIIKILLLIKEENKQSEKPPTREPKSHHLPPHKSSLHDLYCKPISKKNVFENINIVTWISLEFEFVDILVTPFSIVYDGSNVSGCMDMREGENSAPCYYIGHSMQLFIHCGINWFTGLYNIEYYMIFLNSFE